MSAAWMSEVVSGERSPGEVFLESLPEPTRGVWSQVAELEAQLERLHRVGAEQWPGVVIPPRAFARYLGERIPTPAEPDVALAQLHPADLFVVCGCLLGDPRAIAGFRRHFSAGIRSAIRGQGVPPSEVDDVEQRVHERLLVSAAEHSPRLLQYRGQSELGRWLQVVAVRVTLNQVRRKRVDQVASAEWQLDVACPEDDQELRLLRRQYQAEFKSAFLAALEGLTPRERNLLRYQHLDGLTGEELAALYGVHRATTARWIARARRRVLRRTEQLLAERLRLSQASVQSVLALVGCRVTMSLARVLTLDSDG